MLHETDRDARIIGLTSFNGDEDIYRANGAGACAYMLKGVNRQELLQCIREVHGGKYFIPPEVAAKLARLQSSADLTPREMDLPKPAWG